MRLQVGCPGEDRGVPCIEPALRLLRRVTGRYFALVCREGREHFFFLAMRHFSEVKTAPKFGRDLVEFSWRDPEVTMCFLEPQFGFARPCRRIFARSARGGADP